MSKYKITLIFRAIDFFVSLFITFEMGKGQKERERIPSRLHAVSTKPDVGLELRNCEIMT